MMEQIFHDGKKKVVLVIKNLETKQNDLQQSTVFCEERYNAFATSFRFSVNNKKNYKAKFSTNLILKKTNKDNFGRKKTHEKKRCSN